LPKYTDTNIPQHLITHFIKKTIARKKNKIINGCLKLHPGKWMCGNSISGLHTFFIKKPLVTWLGD
jgi:hypothetical protein